MFLETLYGILFAITLFSALMVVLAPHAVYSALFLVMTMVSISGLFLLMNAELAAAFQIIVYAGAIMVLFLFVIMLLNIGQQGPLPIRNRGVHVAGILLVITFVGQMVIILGGLGPGSPIEGTAYNLELPDGPRGIGIQEVGFLLQTDYIYAFAMTSILLLIAMVGAVVLARRHLIQGVHDVSREAARPAGAAEGPRTEVIDV